MVVVTIISAILVAGLLGYLFFMLFHSDKR